MSNRYMPDLLGLSLLVSGTYYLIKIPKKESKNNLYKLGIAIALLSGVRISYLPFFLPIIFLLSFDQLKHVILSSISFFLIWFIPWICITDFSDLIITAINDSQGHFFRWGGTVMSDSSSFQLRFVKTVESLFADSLGFWWYERHWITLVNAILLLPFLILSIILLLKKKLFKHKSSRLIVICFIAYFIWAYFFQNIVYKPRHLMPFIPLSCFLISISYDFIKQRVKSFSIKKILIVLLFPYIFITFKLVSQHKSPSAISQVSLFIKDSKAEKKIIRKL